MCICVCVCGLCCGTILLGSLNAHTWIDSEVLLLLLLNVKQTSIYITHSELPLSFIFHLNESDIHALVLSAHNSMPFFSKHFTPLHFTSLVFGWRLLQTPSNVCQSERLVQQKLHGLFSRCWFACWMALCVCVLFLGASFDFQSSHLLDTLFFSSFIPITRYSFAVASLSRTLYLLLLFPLSPTHTNQRANTWILLTNTWRLWIVFAVLFCCWSFGCC